MTRSPAEISDELFEALQEYFTNDQLVELATAIAQANFRARFNRAFRCQAAGLSENSYCPLPEM
jgi:4-carboxymuconolactone decarboxylase